MREYSEEFEQSVADALKAVEDDYPLAITTVDYIGLRDQLRACQ